MQVECLYIYAWSLIPHQRIHTHIVHSFHICMCACTYVCVNTWNQPLGGRNGAKGEKWEKANCLPSSCVVLCYQLQCSTAHWAAKLTCRHSFNFILALYFDYVDNYSHMHIVHTYTLLYRRIKKNHCPILQHCFFLRFSLPAISWCRGT